MKLFGKLARSVAGGPLERRYIQNVRILGEFPWLWAVKSLWELATDLIEVTDPTQFPLDTSVNAEVTSDHPRIEQFWTHEFKSMNGRPLELVRQVWGRQCSEPIVQSSDKVTWDDLLIWKVGVNTDIGHLAAVTSNGQVVRVIRPPKPCISFCEYWLYRYGSSEM